MKANTKQEKTAIGKGTFTIGKISIAERIVQMKDEMRVTNCF